MTPSNFPLRWESTGDQWWYASPVDWAAANGHYDLVRQLLRLDSNHLIQLTSLRRIRRLESVWDDHDKSQFASVAKHRSQVARQLFDESSNKAAGGKNSLIQSGYGGWLLYTAASAGDLGFVKLLLERDPLLVFGEGEYGVTDILYAAARGKNSDVFRIMFDFAVCPRFSNGKGKWVVEGDALGEVPPAFKQEMVNRAVHAAARGGNLGILKELLGDCSDVLVYRDVYGSTVLHAAAGRGQVEVVKDLISSFDDIGSAVDNQGNTALHIASFRGQLDVVEALIHASPSSLTSTNYAGETLLHMAVSGFQIPGFQRLDRHVEFMKQLVCGKFFNVESIINLENNEGRTALHMAIVGNIDSDLVQLLMTVPSINVNMRDAHGMTPLDILRQGPRSASSEILIRQLISAGGIFGCDEFTARRAIVSRLKMHSIGSSPGTSFRVSDAEIFLHTGIEIGSDSTELNRFDSVYEQENTARKASSMNYAVRRLKILLQWPRMREKNAEKINSLRRDDDSAESLEKRSSSDEIPAPLRQRFSKPSAIPTNKRTLSVRSNQPSPIAKKKFASGLMHGIIQSMQPFSIPRRSRSSSFSVSSISSSNSMDKQKGIYVANDDVDPSCSNRVFGEGEVSSASRSSGNHFLCFGAPSLSVKESISRQRRNQTYNGSVISVA